MASEAGHHSDDGASSCARGKRNKYRLTQLPISASMSVIHNFPTMSAESVMPAAMANTARFRARFGIPWPDCHIEINGPSFGWCVSQWWKRSDDRAKHQLASKINGVVGNTGKNMPATPNTTDTQPKAASRIFLGLI